MPKNIFYSVSLDITYKCNYRCLHCYNSSGSHNFSTELTDKQIISVISYLAEMAPRSFCLCGGEPMMRKELLYKAIRAYKLGNPDNSCNMVSNGYYINPATAQELKEAGIDSVQISLDGATPVTHNWLRSNEFAYDRAINAIKCLHEAGISVSVACTPTKRNISEISELMALCEQLGVVLFRMQPIMNLGRGRNIQDEFLSSSQYIALSRKLSSYKSEMQIEWGDPINHLVEISTGTRKMNFLHISAYGDIQLSPYLPLSFGNINKHSLRDYFDNGLESMISNEFVKLLAGKITSEEKMDLSLEYGLPEIFTGNNLTLDIIEDDIASKTACLIEKFNIR